MPNCHHIGSNVTSNRRYSEKKPLTVHGQSDISLCHPNPRHDGLAGVCSSILLGNSLQLQGVAIAEHLGRNPERGVRSVLGRERRSEGRRGRQRNPGPFISGPLIVEPAQRWADRCNKCWWFKFNFIVKSFNHGIKHSSHRRMAVLQGRLL